MTKFLAAALLLAVFMVMGLLQRAEAQPEMRWRFATYRKQAPFSYVWDKDQRRCFFTVASDGYPTSYGVTHVPDATMETCR